MNFFTKYVYVTEKAAKALNFTHEGWFMGIPIWARDVNTDNPLFWAKVSVLDHLLPVAAWFQQMHLDSFQVTLREI